MGYKENIKAIIAANVYTNHRNLVTAENVKTAEYAIVDGLGAQIDALQGKFYGYFPTAADLPAGDVRGYAFVGASSPYSIYNFDGTNWTNSGSSYAPPVGNGEDINTDSNGFLQFADRVAVDGMGYKILRRDKTFAEQVTVANTIYEIRYDFDLDGGSVTIPSGSILRFNGGTISNGTIVLDNTEIQGAKNSIDCLLDGTFKNGIVHSSWFVNADAVLRSAINCCSIGSNTFYFDDGTYTFTDDIFLYNSVNIRGTGAAKIIFNFDTTGKTGVDAQLCGFLCGAAYRHDNTYQHTWKNASIEGINIGVAGSFSIQSLIYLSSVKNVAIRNCHLDITGGSPTGMNAMICRKNNANVAYPSEYDGIVISNNTLICDKPDFSFAIGGMSGECIGIQLAKNVLVENNKIYRSSDDLGFHSCENVRCVGNYMSTYDARYYASGPVDYWLENNILDVQKSTSMGIMVDRESSAIVAKNIHISGNKVIASGSGVVSYGIRVFYGKGIYISNNDVRQVVIETSADSASPETLTEQEKIANDIFIYHNNCYLLRCQVAPNDKHVMVFGNIIRGSLLVSPCECFGNIFGEDLNIFSFSTLRGSGYIDFVIKPGVVGTTGSYKMKTPTGETEITIPFAHIFLGSEIFATNGGVYSVGYVNGNIILSNKLPDESYETETITSPGATNTVNYRYKNDIRIVNANSKYKVNCYLQSTSTFPGYVVVRLHYLAKKPWVLANDMFSHPYHADNIVDAINAVDYGDLQPA